MPCGGKKKKQVLKQLRIDEISGVDEPAQEGATVLLMKRHDSAKADQGHAPTPKELAKSAALTSLVNGHTHLIALNGGPSGEQLNGGYTSYDQGHCHPWVLDETNNVRIGAVSGDNGVHSHDLDIVSKSADLLKSAQEGEDEPMTETEKKQLDELTKRAERAEKLAKLNDAERAHMEGLPETDRDVFLNKSANDRKAIITKAAKAAQDADPVEYTTSDGIELRKSAGAALIAMAKSNDALIKRNKELDIALQQERLEKRAEDELGHMPGTKQERAAMLKAIESITDDAQREAALKALKASDTALSKAFKMSGHGGEAPDPGSPVEQLEKLAKAYHAKHDDLTYEQAYDAVLQTREGSELYTESVRN